jgi:hypothetical protein
MQLWAGSPFEQPNGRKRCVSGSVSDDCPDGTDVHMRCEYRSSFAGSGTRFAAVRQHGSNYDTDLHARTWLKLLWQDWKVGAWKRRYRVLTWEAKLGDARIAYISIASTAFNIPGEVVVEFRECQSDMKQSVPGGLCLVLLRFLHHYGVLRQ